MNPDSATGALTTGRPSTGKAGSVVKARFDAHWPAIWKSRFLRAVESFTRVNPSLKRLDVVQNFGSHDDIAWSRISEPWVGTVCRESIVQTSAKGRNVTGNTNRLRQLDADCHSLKSADSPA